MAKECPRCHEGELVPKVSNFDLEEDHVQASIEVPYCSTCGYQELTQQRDLTRNLNSSRVQCMGCGKTKRPDEAIRLTYGENKDKYLCMEGDCLKNFLELGDDEVLPSLPAESRTAAAQAYAVA